MWEIFQTLRRLYRYVAGELFPIQLLSVWDLKLDVGLSVFAIFKFVSSTDSSYERRQVLFCPLDCWSYPIHMFPIHWHISNQSFLTLLSYFLALCFKILILTGSGWRGWRAIWRSHVDFLCPNMDVMKNSCKWNSTSLFVLSFTSKFWLAVAAHLNCAATVND